MLGNDAFLRDLDDLVQRVALLGALNSLTQLALKIAMPGTPDFYQGTEFWDLSLVDPDNRRPVDFAVREKTLAALSPDADLQALAGTWADGRIKLALTRRLLAWRQSGGALFARGDYRPLTVEGLHRDRVIAFARIHGGDAALLIAGRHFAAVTNGGRHWPRADAWHGHVLLGDLLLRDASGGQDGSPPDRLPLARAFAHGPVGAFRAQIRLPTKAAST
jgi:(1->4)-alpha-D-glucan 1-alpha-D-glucosylmutase